MANLRIYIGYAIGQNRLSADWLRRRLASGAEGCGFDPRLAYQSSLAGSGQLRPGKPVRLPHRFAGEKIAADFIRFRI